MTRELRWDKIMRMIDEGYTDDEIIEAVKRPREFRAEMNIDVYRLVHDGKTCNLAVKEEQREGYHFIDKPGAWLHGELMWSDRRGMRIPQRDLYFFDGPSYDH